MGASGRLLQLFEGHRLTPTQRRIAHCMVRRAADAPFLSSVELAELAGVSQPSVTRFAVALGFDGYPALRRHLRENTPPEGAEGGDGAESEGGNEYQQAVYAEIENLRRTAALLSDPAPVERAGALLAASRPLPVLGLRAAAAQAGGFAYFAAKVHPDVRLLTEGGSMLVDRLDGCVQAGAAHCCASRCPATPARPSRPSRTRGRRGCRSSRSRTARSRRSRTRTTSCCPPLSAPASPSTPPARPCSWAGCFWRPCATACPTRRPGWRTSTRAPGSAGSSPSEPAVLLCCCAVVPLCRCAVVPCEPATSPVNGPVVAPRTSR